MTRGGNGGSDGPVPVEGCWNWRMDVQINGHKNSDKANQILHTANAAPFRRTNCSQLCFLLKTPNPRRIKARIYLSRSLSLSLFSLSSSFITTSARSRDITKIMRRRNAMRTHKLTFTQNSLHCCSQGSMYKIRQYLTFDMF